jgi:hypothetical protein
MELETVVLASGADSTLSWEGLTEGIQGWPVHSDEVERLSLVAFGLDKESLLEAITSNTLLQSDVADYRLLEDSVGRTSASLSDFGVMGNGFLPEADFIENAEHTWLVSLWDLGVEGRDEIRTSLHLEPSTAATLTQAVIDDQSAAFTFIPELVDLDPLGAPAKASQLRVDWSGLSVDAMGNVLDPLQADRMALLHLDADSLSSIEEDFQGHIRDAKAIYRSDVRGQTEGSLADCQSSDGESFGGFSSDGIWLLGLECSTCTSPIPLVLTVIEIEG